MRSWYTSTSGCHPHQRTHQLLFGDGADNSKFNLHITSSEGLEGWTLGLKEEGFEKKWFLTEEYDGMQVKRVNDKLTPSLGWEKQNEILLGKYF